MRYSIEPRDIIYVKGYGCNKADAIKTASKRATQKTAEATGDLIGNKTTDKITSVSKKKPDKELHNNDETEDVETATPKNDTYLQKKESKLLRN